MWHWVEVEVNYIRTKLGQVFRLRRFNFIVIHYIYMLAWTISGSILLFPSGGLSYIDALFFAAGASTQSGLNTVNINQLNTSQQVVLYFIAMFTNPIVIHSTVVFVRLYWFEKRFQHVVQEAMQWRRSRTRTMTMPKVEEASKKDEGEGVRGKSIVMLQDGHRIGSGDNQDFAVRDFQDTADQTAAAMDPSSSSEKKDTDSTKSQRSQVPPLASDRFKREVLFADQVMASPGPMSPMRLPEPRSPDHHIAFLERQRNPEDTGALRIPGPRDFDRGKVPERVSTEDQNNDLVNVDSASVAASADEEKKAELDRNRRHSDQMLRPQSDPRFRRNITIDDSARAPPSRPAPMRKTQSHQGRVAFRRNNTNGSNAVVETDDPLPPRPRPRARSNTLASFLRATTTHHDPGPVPYLSWQPTVGRNSAFVDLTEDQREELGGIEYRSLKTLAVIVISYFFFFHILGVITFLPWIMRTDEWGSVVDADGVNRPWWAIFSSATLFNDLGFTLTPDSFISFQLAVLPLLLGAILIVVGNTGFPCMLRLWIWLLQKVVPQESGLWEELRFLLDHPRRCFTLLFPASATWVLFGILIVLNGIDLIFFIILDINDSAVDVLPPGFRVLNGLFQATSTRTSGTAVVNLADLHPGIQVSYLIMMYISVFPIAISMRRTNVYEERSLGMYSSGDEDEEDTKEPSYVGAHLRKQLSFDLWFVFLGLFIIAIAEGTRIADLNEPAFDLFACLFEIVSAYGTVGLSLGYPNIDASFSAEFTTVSKLVIIAMMIRGRHRGLPYELDRAILLPSENLHVQEDQDAARRNRRLSQSSFSRVGSTGVASGAPFRPGSTGGLTGLGLSTGVDASAVRPVHSRGSHRSGTHPVRDHVAKLPEGLAHVNAAAKVEREKHDKRPST